MNKHLRKTLVAAAVAGAMVSGIPGTASAYEYAMSHINVASFTTTPFNPGTIDSFTFNLQNTAALTGFTSVISTASCGGVPGGGAPFNTCLGVFAPNVLDASVASIPGGARAENSYGFIGPTNVSSYATADSVLRTAQLVTGPPTAFEMISEVNVSGNGIAQGGAQIQSNTTISFNVVASNGFALDFTADPDLRAAILSTPGVHSAQANLTATFTLTSNTNDNISITWSPQGSVANDCVVSAAAVLAGVTCVETADSQDLNISRSTGVNPSDVDFSFEAGNVQTPFGIVVLGLPLDTYSVALVSNASANVLSIVPEPASIALVGLGLLGMGFGLRRRNRNI